MKRYKSLFEANFTPIELNKAIKMLEKNNIPHKIEMKSSKVWHFGDLVEKKKEVITGNYNGKNFEMYLKRKGNTKEVIGITITEGGYDTLARTFKKAIETLLN